MEIPHRPTSTLSGSRSHRTALSTDSTGTLPKLSGSPGSFQQAKASTVMPRFTYSSAASLVSGKIPSLPPNMTTAFPAYPSRLGR